MPNSLPKVDFKAKQREFAAYIRDPNNNPLPLGIKKKRMQMYRQLFFNNVEGFLAGNFPVLRQILSNKHWLDLVQDFFSTHTCESPYFVEIPEEFIAYLQNERHHVEDLPFLVELAHYEWVEMALSIAKGNVPLSDIDTAMDSDTVLQLSTLAWPLAYRYPVHKISPHFIPLMAPTQPTCLVVYRDEEDDVHFLDITLVTYRLLEIIQENDNMTVRDCLTQIAQETQQNNLEQTIIDGLVVLKELQKKAIVTVKGS